MDIRFSNFFKKELKRLLKKYPSLGSDLETLVKEIRLDPKRGKPIGKDCYKIRLAIKSKGRGKSGGARIITCVVNFRETVTLLAIYDKAEQENMSDALLNQLLKEYIEE